jgi:hypothetical protein
MVLSDNLPMPPEYRAPATRPEPEIRPEPVAKRIGSKRRTRSKPLVTTRSIPLVTKDCHATGPPDLCPHCAGSHIIRFGYLRNGLQRYRCRGCSKTFCPEAKSREIYIQRKRDILSAYFLIGSMRAVARLYGVSRNTVRAWLKQEEILPT